MPLCAVLCSQGLFAQTPGRKVLGINEMFRLADENSQSIQTYKTGKEAADEALKAAKSQRLPDIGASLSFSYLATGICGTVTSKTVRTSLCPTSAITSLWKPNRLFTPAEHQQQHYPGRTRTTDGRTGLAEKSSGDTLSSDRLLSGFIQTRTTNFRLYRKTLI